jgi:hypothetical protein
MKYRYETHECPRQYGFTVYEINEFGVEVELEHTCGLDSRREAKDAAKLVIQEQED